DDGRLLNVVEIERFIGPATFGGPGGGGLDGRDQGLVAPGLEDEIDGAALERLHGQGYAAIGGHQQDRQVGIDGVQVSEAVETLAAAALADGEVHVEQDGV